jgi:hypothetical protein
MKKKYAYNLDDVGIMPANFTTVYVSGSVGFGTFDDADPNLPAFKCWEVADYEYAMEPQRIFYQAIESGYDTGLGYSLGLSTEDRNAFASFLTQYANKEAIGTATASSTVALADTEGHLHYMTLQEARVLLDAYSDYYSGLWVAYKSAIS